MLARIKKLWLFFSHFIHARKTWGWPRQSAVLIYDITGQELLLEYLRNWAPEALHLRGEQVNMRVLFASLFKRGKGLDAYVDCFIERVRPRLIVTLIDNSPGFHSLAIRHPKVKTLFVQNGSRGYLGDIFEFLDRAKSPANRLKVDYMMTFGSRIGAEYAKYMQGSVVPMGSLRNNLVPKRENTKTGTIAFVSQFRKTTGFMLGDKFYSFGEFFEQADRLVLGFLVKYAEKRGKELFIIPSRGHLKDDSLEKEKEYYHKLLGQRCVFSQWHWRGSSYEALDSAEVAVTIDSTLGYESAARGTKTAMFSIRSRLLSLMDPPFLSYGWPEPYPDDGPFWTNRPDPAAFERILDHLFAINDAQWRAELAQNQFGNTMIYDPGNTVLQSVLQRELGAPATATCVQ